MTIKQDDFTYLNKEFKGAGPSEILHWSIENLIPDLAIMTSFQISGMVILDIIRKKTDKVPVYFIDTGYHFKETLEFRDRIINEFDLQIKTVKPVITRNVFEKKHGIELFNSNPDFCCSVNKIEPQERAMRESGFHHWISGIRKDQSSLRSNHEVFMHDGNGFIRVHPLLNWKWSNVWSYLDKNKVPFHPLYDFGYSSIGCSPKNCTSPAGSAKDERSGRWKNMSKTECGLHEKLTTEITSDVSRAS